MKNAPNDFTPWLFPVRKNGKAPGVDKGVSWKKKEGLLSIKESLERLKKNKGNVGISGRKNDQLILIDIDVEKIENELKPTLKIKSRSRIGCHGVYWANDGDEKLPMNIPTDKGEVRSSDQYVVAPGSYTPCTKKELNKKLDEGKITKEDMKRVLNDPNRGYYTVENERPPGHITYEELPRIFKVKVDKDDKKRKEIEKIRKGRDSKPKTTEGNQSALFDLEITDVVPTYSFNERNPHPLHTSETGENFSVSKNGLAHCWRHLVSLNAIQFLVVKSGYMGCEEAGTGHNNSQGRKNAGPSYIIGDDGAIFHAWLEAKDCGVISEDDKIPIRALNHIARRHGIYDTDNDEMLPKWAYNRTLEVLEEEY